MIVIGIVIMFVVVAVTPICRRYESIWIFLLTLVLTVPVNIGITKSVIEMGILELEFPLGRLINVIEIYLPLLAMEELMLGILGRMIWPRQYCWSMKEENEK